MIINYAQGAWVEGITPTLCQIKTKANAMQICLSLRKVTTSRSFKHTTPCRDCRVSMLYKGTFSIM